MEPTLLSSIDIILRLGIATLLGMSLGIERAVAGKTAGMRTYALVSMGAALFVLISLMAPQIYAALFAHDMVSIDPVRIAAQVVVGIGFIGAGLIIFRDAQVRGLTTAAGLWVSAGIGLSAGYGLYVLALSATVLTLLVFTVMWFVEYEIKRFSQDQFSESREPSEEL